MKVFGVDPGSRVTGFGVIESSGTRLACLDYGKIEGLKGGGSSDFAQRLVRIYRGLKERIAQHQPEVVAVEKVFHAVNVQTALKLGHARGVILLAAAEAGVPILEYSPLEIKKSVVGYGRAEKTQVQMMVKTLLNLRRVPQPHDAADALAVAICHSFNGAPRRRSRQRWKAPR